MDIVNIYLKQNYEPDDPEASKMRLRFYGVNSNLLDWAELFLDDSQVKKFGIIVKEYGKTLISHFNQSTDLAL